MRIFKLLLLTCTLFYLSGCGGDSDTGGGAGSGTDSIAAETPNAMAPPTDIARHDTVGEPAPEGIPVIVNPQQTGTVTVTFAGNKAKDIIIMKGDDTVTQGSSCSGSTFSHTMTAAGTYSVRPMFHDQPCSTPTPRMLGQLVSQQRTSANKLTATYSRAGDGSNTSAIVVIVNNESDSVRIK